MIFKGMTRTKTALGFSTMGRRKCETARKIQPSLFSNSRYHGGAAVGNCGAALLGNAQNHRDAHAPADAKSGGADFFPGRVQSVNQRNQDARA